VKFKLLILRVLKILERDQSNQKFEVYPVTGDSKNKAVTARVVTAIFVSWCTSPQKTTTILVATLSFNLRDK
jgi:hypothetical protein